jgi:hypothetical protein
MRIDGNRHGTGRILTDFDGFRRIPTDFDGFGRKTTDSDGQATDFDGSSHFPYTCYPFMLLTVNVGAKVAMSAIGNCINLLLDVSGFRTPWGTGHFNDASK